MSTESTEAVEQQELDRYECASCGYVYEPAKGDNLGNIAAGTAFETLPDVALPSLRCPQASFQ